MVQAMLRAELEAEIVLRLILHEKNQPRVYSLVVGSVVIFLPVVLRVWLFHFESHLYVVDCEIPQGFFDINLVYENFLADITRNVGCLSWK